MSGDEKQLCVLAVDVGGSHVKVLLNTGSERRRFESGPDITARQMADGVLELTHDWEYDVVSVGVPTQVMAGRVVHDPVNLGPGWAGFDFEGAFGKPTRVVNDAVMQALGSYEGGRMLFLGLGTGLGTAMIVDGLLEPMELGHLPYRKLTYEDFVGERGLVRLGKKRWREEVATVIAEFTAALEPDYVVLGGGNAKLLKELPPNSRLGANENAFLGGFRLWDAEPARPGEEDVRRRAYELSQTAEGASPEENWARAEHELSDSGDPV
ncbi:MAG: ROK family protein [Acidimicrobiales bacterium]